MNLKTSSIMVLFIIFLIVSLTPAFAIQMEEVANDAKNYEIDSHKNKGFFDKIHFLAKGFKLVKTAQNAQKGSNPQETNTKTDTYDEMLNGTLNSFCQAHNLLNFRNTRKKTIETLKNQKSSNENMMYGINATKDPTNTINSTKNSSSIMNSTKNSMGPVSNTANNFEIPNYCQIDARFIRDQLATQGITTSISNQQEISKALEGKIVQIIDDKGYLRYVMVENITDSQVTLVTNNNSTKNMSLDEFKAAYTGIILETTSGVVVIDKILEIQKSIQQLHKNMSTRVKNDTKSKIILWSILAGVAILLIIIGALIGIFFAKVLANNVTSQASAFVETTCEETCNTLSTQVAHAGGCMPAFGDFEGTLYTVTATEDFVAGNVGGVSAATAAALGMGGSLAALATVGLIVIPIIGFELVSNVLIQNWIKVILGSVGLILVIVGLALAITSIFYLVDNVEKFITMSICYNEIVKENNALNGWIKSSEPYIIPVNNSKTIITDNNSLNNTNNEFNLNRRIIPSSF